MLFGPEKVELLWFCALISVHGGEKEKMDLLFKEQECQNPASLESLMQILNWAFVSFFLLEEPVGLKLWDFLMKREVEVGGWGGAGRCLCYPGKWKTRKLQRKACVCLSDQP